MTDALLPSWRPGTARDAIVAFLDGAAAVPPDDRVACFDNDGTLWCERPSFAQFDFYLDALRRRVKVDPTLGARPEFLALLGGDATAIDELGLEQIATALAGLFEGLTPDAFAAEAQEFMRTATHSGLGRPLRSVVYQPMLELIQELHRRGFTVGVVTGGGTEFVRSISRDLYGVPAELVVGTLIGYELARDAWDRPELHRTGSILGTANEGAAKVANIQTQVGRRPIVAGGNSGGDREMLEWACAGPVPGFALVIDHDDADREYAYEGQAQTFAEAELITATAERLGWTVVSMARDWDVVFPPG